MLGQNISRATSQCIRAASQPQKCSRTMATAAGINPFHFTTSSEKGIKIASRDDGAPTTSLALVIRAGSRYETAPGLAHALQQFTWKNTERRSALRVQRESELLGAKIGSTLSHENIVLKAQFLRQDLPYFVEAMGDVLTSTRFQHHIFTEETLPTIKHEIQRHLANPAEVAYEKALNVAFHNGLGSSKYSFTKSYVTPGSISDYASLAYNKSNIALVASGAAHSDLSKWTQELLGGVKDGAKLTSKAAKYYGGQTRLSSTHGNAFVIAFPGTAGSPNFKAEYKVIAHLLGGQTAVKWNTGFSLLSRAVANLPGVSAVASHSSFSDAGLLHITVTGPGALLEQAGQEVVKTLQEAANVSAEQVKKAIAQAKFDVLAEVEDRSIGLELVGQSLLLNGSAPQAEEIVKALDGVTVDTVKKTIATILNGRATFTAVGDLHVLPFAEEIGLKV